MKTNGIAMINPHNGTGSKCDQSILASALPVGSSEAIIQTPKVHKSAVLTI